MPRRNVLLSIHDRRKPELPDFARALVALDFTLWASGGTARCLLDAGLEVRDVADIVGGEASDGHLVVTISREIALGLLQPDNEESRAKLARDNIPFFDMVVVATYPLREELDRDGSTVESIRDQTDIGGPHMLRMGAKGRRIVVGDSISWDIVLRWLQAGEPDNEIMRLWMAREAEGFVSYYTDYSFGALMNATRGFNPEERPWAQD